MTELQQKQLAFLEETVAFYNLNNRCVSLSGMCRYHIDGKDGCAIGRKIKDKDICHNLDSFEGDTGVDEVEIFEQLPPELKELGQNFLYRIQVLHDTKDNWRSDGISDSGLERVKSIKRSFGFSDSQEIIT